MSIGIPQQATNEDAVPADVEAAWRAYLAAQEQHFGPVLLKAQTVLIKAAEAADVDLCQWSCNSPHTVTRRSCCQDLVCDDHTDEHDLLCAEFGKQLLEEIGR